MTQFVFDINLLCVESSKNENGFTPGAFEVAFVYVRLFLGISISVDLSYLPGFRLFSESEGMYFPSSNFNAFVTTTYGAFLRARLQMSRTLAASPHIVSG